MLAHYLADLYDEPAEALRWNVRALDAADALTDSRAREHDGRLSVAGFYPSLHLNLAEDLRRLGAFDAAGAQLAAARRHEHVLGDDDYGAMLRQAFDDVSRAITARSVSPLPVTGSR